jgi:hypothetical protein
MNHDVHQINGDHSLAAAILASGIEALHVIGT